MSWDFDYARAWQNLALPLYMAQPDELKKLVNKAVVLTHDQQQNKALGMEWPTPELKAEFMAVSPQELAALSRIVNDYGHWKPSWAKPLCDDDAPLTMPWIDNKEVVRESDPNNIPVVYAAPDNWGGHWKFSHLADQALRAQLGKPEMQSACSNGVSLQVHQGLLRLCFGSRNEWIWDEICLATPKNYEILKRVSCSEILRDTMRLRGLREELGTGTRLDEFLDMKASGYYTHKEGTDMCDDELIHGYQPFLEPVLQIAGVHRVNWRVDGKELDGHPYVIGRKHMSGNSMYIDTTIGCAKCGAPAKSHTCDKIFVLALQRDCTEQEVKTKLVSINRFMAHDKIEGVVFLESSAGYKMEPTPV